MALKYTTLSEIEPGVRDLVRIMNQIPFIDTDQSCEGHLRNPYSRLSPIPKNMKDVRLEPPALIFYVDGKLSWGKDGIKLEHFNHPLAAEFIERVEKFSRAYPSTDFRMLNSYDESNPKPEYFINFDAKIHDLSQTQVFAIDIARKKKTKYDKLIIEFTRLCEDFVSEHGLN
ncbi:MAG: hypothetical protein NT129_00530 [Candidatus Aenigmarchaeota archaeon]|nr:hypothetical protein [Candidatus Aenigmarchaeota archaeon]